MPRILGHAERRHANLYDALRLLRAEPPLASVASVRLFGNTHIGMKTWTNLQVGGRLTCDQGFWIQNWYARTNVVQDGDAHRAFEEWANTSTVTMYVGDKPHRMLSVYDLLRRRQWIPEIRLGAEMEKGEHLLHQLDLEHGSYGVPVPDRQWFSMTVENDMRAAGKMLELLRRDIAPEAAVWFHVEGFMERDHA